MSLIIGMLSGLSVIALVYAGVRYDQRQARSRPAFVPKVRPVYPVPAPPPELSCFVKGIIKSMCENPDEWNVSDHRCTHSKTNLDMRRRRAHSRGWLDWKIEGQSISDAESTAIQRQGVAYLQALAGQKRDAVRAAARAPFEALGCPPTQPS